MARVPSKRRARVVWLSLGVAFVALAGAASIVTTERRVTGRCLLKPVAQWTLTELQPGSLESKAVDLATGQTRHYRLYQFDRQAFVQLDLPQFRSQVDSRMPCASGQRVATVRSSSVDLNAAHRLTALHAAEARLATLRSGTRPEELDRARVAKEQAETALEAFRLRYERNKRLHETHALSDEAWEETEATLRLRALDVELARRELRVLEAGSRPEEIAEAEGLVKSLLAEVDAQETMSAAQAIESPIDGWLRVGAANGPMVSVSVLDTMVVEIAVPQYLSSYPERGSQVVVSVPGVSSALSRGRVLRIDKRATLTPEGSFVVAYAAIANPGHVLDEGLEGRATILCGRETLLGQLSVDVLRALREGFTTN